MKNKEKIIELLENISNMNDEVLALLRGEESQPDPPGTGDEEDASQPDPPGTGGG